MSRRATGGLLQGGAVGNDRVAWHVEDGLEVARATAAVKLK